MGGMDFRLEVETLGDTQQVLLRRGALGEPELIGDRPRLVQRRSLAALDSSTLTHFGLDIHIRW